MVKKLYITNKNLIEKIEFNFPGIIENGVLNNQKLAKIIFSSKFYRSKLEKIVWPYVINELKILIKQQSPNAKIIIDAPTLFESGADKFCNFNVAILSHKSKRFNRIIKRDNLTDSMAINRINSQQPDSFYINKADGLIINNGLKISLFYNLIYLIKNLKHFNYN